MKNLIPASAHNPCLVCGDVSGDCRTSQRDSDYFQCRTHSGARKFEIINGFKNIGATSCGDWGQFKLDKASAQLTDSEQAAQRAKRAAEKVEENQLLLSGLDVEERHAAYSQLTAQLNLHSADRDDLQRRGLSAATIQQFVSIEPWQRLTQPIDRRTPCSDGSKLLTPHTGYLVPSKDLQGRITGFQIRNRDVSPTAPKYPWLSTAGRPAKLCNGELPLTFVEGDRSVVNFTEGLLKPMVAAELFGQAVIGAAGGQFAGSPEQLKAWLTQLKPNRLILCPDGGAYKNASVMRQYRALADLLAGFGHELEVRRWGQFTKADGDVDEISLEKFNSAVILSWADFAAMQPSEQTIDQKIHQTAQGKKQAAAEKKAAKKQQKQTAAEQMAARKKQNHAAWTRSMASIAGLPPNSKPSRSALNKALAAKQLLPAKHQEGDYSAIELAPEGERVLYAFDGQKATKKTSKAILSIVNAAKAKGQSCLVVVPSRLLSKAASKVLDITCHLDKRNADTARYLATCPESLYKFSLQHWDVVVYDEVNEDILRTFNGSLGVNPEMCQKVTRRILESASTIVVANDQMYRASVQAVQRMAKISPQEVITVQRKRPPSEVTIKLYLDMISGDERGDNGDKREPSLHFYGWVGKLVEHIEAGEKVAIPCGSQTKARMIDRLLKAHFKGKRDAEGRQYRGQTLDGKFTPSKVKTDFADGADAWLAEKRPHWLIWTPCFNSGVSIESDYFTAQFECLSVFEAASAASQRGERVRGVLGGSIKVRHVYSSNRGLSRLPDPAMFTADYWQRLAEETIKGRTTPSDPGLVSTIGADGHLVRHRADLAATLTEKSELFEYEAIAAREVYFKLETLVAEWEGNGWTVEKADISSVNVTVWQAALKAAKQSIIECQSGALSLAKGVQGEGQDLSPYAAVRAKKFHLWEQLGSDYARLKDSKWIEAWAIAPDTSGGIKAQRVHQLIMMSVEDPDLYATVLKLDTMRKVSSSVELESSPSLPIPAKEIALAQLLIGCPGVVEILTGRRTLWTWKDAVVKEARDYLLKHAAVLAALSKHSQRILGYQFNRSTPLIKCLNKALALAGAVAATDGRVNKVWHYRLKNEADAQKKIDEKAEKKQPAEPSEYREVFRFNTLSDLRVRLSAHLKVTVPESAEDWQATAVEIARTSGGEVPVLIRKPDVEQAVEPVVEQAVEPVVEPAVEPVVEPAVEPVAEPAVEPVAEPATVYHQPLPPLKAVSLESELRLLTSVAEVAKAEAAKAEEVKRPAHVAADYYDAGAWASHRH